MQNAWSYPCQHCWRAAIIPPHTAHYHRRIAALMNRLPCLAVVIASCAVGWWVDLPKALVRRGQNLWLCRNHPTPHRGTTRVATHLPVLTKESLSVPAYPWTVDCTVCRGCRPRTGMRVSCRPDLRSVMCLNSILSKIKIVVKSSLESTLQ